MDIYPTHPGNHCRGCYRLVHTREHIRRSMEAGNWVKMTFSLTVNIDPDVWRARAIDGPSLGIPQEVFLETALGVRDILQRIDPTAAVEMSLK